MAERVNHSGSSFFLGQIYLNSEDGIPKDINKAMYWFNKSLSIDDTPATKHYIGVCHEQKGDWVKACQIYNESLAYPSSQYHIGMILIYGGGGVPANHVKALEHLKYYADAQNNKESQYGVSSIYLKMANQGVAAVNLGLYDLGLLYHQRSAAGGYVLAQVSLPQMTDLVSKAKAAVANVLAIS